MRPGAKASHLLRGPLGTCAGMHHLFGALIRQLTARPADRAEPSVRARDPLAPSGGREVGAASLNATEAVTQGAAVASGGHAPVRLAPNEWSCAVRDDLAAMNSPQDLTASARRALARQVAHWSWSRFSIGSGVSTLAYRPATAGRPAWPSGAVQPARKTPRKSAASEQIPANAP